MSIPVEFSAAAIDAAMVDPSAGATAYRDFYASGEPYRSLRKHNPWTKPPAAGSELEWGKGWYYDTTVARKHPHWRNVVLPTPTKDLKQLMADFVTWGYCLLEDGVSDEQCERLHTRVLDQAAAERALGIGHVSAAQQHVWSLVNKGDDFVRCMVHDTESVQSGLLIERFLDAMLNPGWIHLSFIANISYPGCHPQGLHQDQSIIAPHVPTEAPVLVNTIYVLQDVDEHNGGTLIIPGSHRRNGTDGDMYGPLPPAINVEAKAGTILFTDGRLFHGGAVNRSERLRAIITNSVVRPWMRQQEAFLLTISPDVLRNASEKFLMRVGYQSTSSAGMVEGYGYFGNGRVGDPNGALVHVRRAIDNGGYTYVPALSLDDVDRIDPESFTLGRIQREHETYRDERYLTTMAAIAPR